LRQDDGVTTPPQYASPPPPGYGYPGYGPVPPGYGYPPAPTSPRGEPLATFDKRLLAYLIDGAILGAAGLAIMIPIYLVAFLRLIREINVVNAVPADTTNPSVPFSAFATFFALFGVGLLLLYVVMYLYQVELGLRGGGQTPGKKVMKIRIVPLNPAEILTRRHLALRFLATVGLNLVPAGSWIDGLWQLWDKPYCQCLHDKAARTVVVRLST
jgi:uncharacterized RDD family membrane protein YckC